MAPRGNFRPWPRMHGCVRGWSGESNEHPMTALEPVARSGLFHGWRLVGSGFVLQGLATAAVSYSYGVVLAPIAGEFGASRFEMMWGITASTLVSGVVSPFLGVAMDRPAL